MPDVQRIIAAAYELPANLVVEFSEEILPDLTLFFEGNPCRITHIQHLERNVLELIGPLESCPALIRNEASQELLLVVCPVAKGELTIMVNYNFPRAIAIPLLEDAIDAANDIEAARSFGQPVVQHLTKTPTNPTSEVRKNVL